MWVEQLHWHWHWSGWWSTQLDPHPRPSVRPSVRVRWEQDVRDKHTDRDREKAKRSEAKRRTRAERRRRRRRERRESVLLPATAVPRRIRTRLTMNSSSIIQQMRREEKREDSIRWRGKDQVALAHSLLLVAATLHRPSVRPSVWQLFTIRWWTSCCRAELSWAELLFGLLYCCCVHTPPNSVSAPPSLLVSRPDLHLHHRPTARPHKLAFEWRSLRQPPMHHLSVFFSSFFSTTLIDCHDRPLLPLLSGWSFLGLFFSFFIYLFFLFPSFFLCAPFAWRLCRAAELPNCGFIILEYQTTFIVRYATFSTVANCCSDWRWVALCSQATLLSDHRWVMKHWAALHCTALRIGFHGGTAGRWPPHKRNNIQLLLQRSVIQSAASIM